LEALHKSKLGFFHTFIEDAVLNERLVAMLRGMKETCSVAMVTSCSRKNCDELLEHFKLDDLFEKVIAGDDVARQKPDPEGYTAMMKHFEVTPEDTVIYEDSKHGIAAAQASGAQVHIVQWDGV
jgi:HAD superfamily hydrolase (TIGR01509 family)